MLEIMAFLAPREEVHTVLPDWSRLPVYSSIFGRSRSKTRKKTKGTAKKEIDEVLKFYYRLSQLTEEATDEEEEYLENACVIMASTRRTVHNVRGLNAQGWNSRCGVSGTSPCGWRGTEMALNFRI
jgi:hypothetical protein